MPASITTLQGNSRGKGHDLTSSEDNSQKYGNALATASNFMSMDDWIRKPRHSSNRSNKTEISGIFSGSAAENASQRAAESDLNLVGGRKEKSAQTIRADRDRPLNGLCASGFRRKMVAPSRLAVQASSTTCPLSATAAHRSLQLHPKSSSRLASSTKFSSLRVLHSR